MYYGIPCPGTGEISQNLYTHTHRHTPSVSDARCRWRAEALAANLASPLGKPGGSAVRCAGGDVFFAWVWLRIVFARGVRGLLLREERATEGGRAECGILPGSSCTVWVTVFHSVDWIIILKIQIWRYTFRLWFPTTDNNNGYVWYTLKDRSFETYDVMPRTVQRAAAKPNCKVLINKKKSNINLCQWFSTVN